MRIRQTSILLGSLCIATTALAESAKVAVELKDGTRESALTTETRISFKAGAASIENAGTAVSIPLADINRIRLVTTSGVTASTADPATWRLRTNPVESVLDIAGYDGTPARLTVHSTGGQTLRLIGAWSGEPVYVDDLASGVYLLTINNETIKFIKK